MTNDLILPPTLSSDRTDWIRGETMKAIGLNILNKKLAVL
jgi:hypothetical protein